MGKIRVKTFGDEEAEKKEQQKKEARKESKKTAKAPGLKGGERVVAVGPSEEDLAKMETPVTPVEEKKETKKAKTNKKVGTKTKTRSERYLSAKMQVEPKLHSLSEALDVLSKLQKSKFDETVELHVNTTEAGISGSMTLPHGTGKKIRVVVATDAIIASVEKGKIEFDVLVATPDMMPKLAKVAKYLGPRGLMPNPKNGTITPKPEEVIKKYEGGQVTFKTEAKSPIIHLSVGKISFGKEKLTTNIQTALNALPSTKVKTITLKSTMSPAIKLQIAA